MRIQLVIAAFGLVALPNSAFAWGAAGHEMVATIAQLHLHPDVLPILCDILDTSSSSAAAGVPCHPATIASWADRIKGQPEYRYTSALHYVNARDDHPPDSCAFPGAHGWMGKSGANILGAIQNVTGVLASYVGAMKEGGVSLLMKQ